MNYHYTHSGIHLEPSETGLQDTVIVSLDDLATGPMLRFFACGVKKSFDYDLRQLCPAVIQGRVSINGSEPHTEPEDDIQPMTPRLHRMWDKAEQLAAIVRNVVELHDADTYCLSTEELEEARALIAEIDAET